MLKKKQMGWIVFALLFYFLFTPVVYGDLYGEVYLEYRKKTWF